MTRSMQRKISCFIATFILSNLGLFGMSEVAAHGGVVYGEDQCLININFLQAHFTVFQPETRGNDEFCESIPDVTRSVFVMEYLHQLLSELEIDFRIIEDVDGLGRYANWDDVQAIPDLEAVTVYYDPPRIEPGGYYRASHDFEKKGMYIGIVTATHPIEDRDYNAVFYFQVGRPDLGTMPLFVLMLVLLQLGYWWSTGGLAKFKRRFAGGNKKGG